MASVFPEGEGQRVPLRRVTERQARVFAEELKARGIDDPYPYLLPYDAVEAKALRVLLECSVRRVMGKKKNKAVNLCIDVCFLPGRIIADTCILIFSLFHALLYLIFRPGIKGLLPFQTRYVRHSEGLYEWGWHDPHPIKFCERSVKCDTIVNVRTLGGLEGINAEGEKVQTNNKPFFRGGRVEKSTDKDIQILKEEHGIKTVLDLRGLKSIYGTKVDVQKNEDPIDKAYPWDPEISADKAGTFRRIPVRLINSKLRKTMARWGIMAGLAWGRLPLVTMSLWGMRRYVDVIEFLEYRLGLTSANVVYNCTLADYIHFCEYGRALIMATADAAYSLPKFYCKMLEISQKELKQTMDICADPKNHPILFHCEFGKDRTAIVAALLLACAGVSEEAICNDYFLSELFTRSRTFAKLTESKGLPDYVLGPAGYNFMSNRKVHELVAKHGPEYMQEVFTWFKTAGYGDAIGYLEAIGVDQAQRNRIRDSLVGDTSQ